MTKVVDTNRLLGSRLLGLISSTSFLLEHRCSRDATPTNFFVSIVINAAIMACIRLEEAAFAM